MKTDYRLQIGRRTTSERFRDAYALIRVAAARIMRGDKPRFKTLFR